MAKPAGRRESNGCPGVLGGAGAALTRTVWARRRGEIIRRSGAAVTVRYIDPGYLIRSAPADASDAVYCQELGQNAVHAAMAGKTEMLVGRIHGRQVHVPIAAVTTGRKTLDPQHPLWRAVLQSTGQPERMVNG